MGGAVLGGHGQAETGGVPEGELPREEAGSDLVAEAEDHLLLLFGTVFQIDLYAAEIVLHLVVPEGGGDDGVLSVGPNQDVGAELPDVGVHGDPLVGDVVRLVVDPVLDGCAGGHRAVDQLLVEVHAVDDERVGHPLGGVDGGAVGQDDIRRSNGAQDFGPDTVVFEQRGRDDPSTVDGLSRIVVLFQKCDVPAG